MNTSTCLCEICAWWRNNRRQQQQQHHQHNQHHQNSDRQAPAMSSLWSQQALCTDDASPPSNNGAYTPPIDIASHHGYLRTSQGGGAGTPMNGLFPETYPALSTSNISTPSSSIFDQYIDLVGCTTETEILSNNDPSLFIRAPGMYREWSMSTESSGSDISRDFKASSSSTQSFPWPLPLQYSYSSDASAQSVSPSDQSDSSSDEKTVFYVRPHIAGFPPESDRYIAIYVSNLCLSSFLKVLTRKTNIHRRMIGEVMAVRPGGRPIHVDDDFIRRMPYGQALVAELYVSEGSTCRGGHPLLLRFQ